MKKRALLLSVLLHAGILLIMFADFGFWHIQKDMSPPVTVMMVDLTRVTLSDKTNLPPKVKQTQSKTPQKTQAKPTAPKTPSKPVKSTEKKQAPVKTVKPEPQKIPHAAQAVASQTEKKVQPKTPPTKKETAAPKTRASTQAQTKAPKKQTSDLKSLLASVEKMRQPVDPPEQDAAAAQEQAVHDGIEGGTIGSLTQTLTISERDLIASKMRGCWNVDAGADGLEDILVEIRAALNRDGSIRSVQILNNKNTPVFQSVAESARRAVYICADKGDESPFKILADKYADHYHSWKEIQFNFNPVSGGIF